MKYRLTALFALFALIAVLVCSGATDRTDQNLLLGIHSGATTVANSFWLQVNGFGGPFFILPATVVVAAILWRIGKSRKAAFVLSGMAISASLNLALRHAFHRSRPELWPTLQPNHSFVYGFPGGHATLVATLGLLSFLVVEHRRTLVAVLAGLYVLLVGYSSLYLGVHYPSDLIGGWIMACLTCLALAQLPYFGLTNVRTTGQEMAIA